MSVKLSAKSVKFFFQIFAWFFQALVSVVKIGKSKQVQYVLSTLQQYIFEVAWLS